MLRFTEPNLLVGRNEDATPCRNSTNAPFVERSETSFGEQNLRPMFQLSERLLVAACEKKRIQNLMLWGGSSVLEASATRLEPGQDATLKHQLEACVVVNLFFPGRSCLHMTQGLDG